MNSEDYKVIVGIILFVSAIAFFFFVLPAFSPEPEKFCMILRTNIDTYEEMQLELTPEENEFNFGSIIGIPVIIAIAVIVGYLVYQRTTEG